MVQLDSLIFWSKVHKLVFASPSSCRPLWVLCFDGVKEPGLRPGVTQQRCLFIRGSLLVQCPPSPRGDYSSSKPNWQCMSLHCVFSHRNSCVCPCDWLCVIPPIYAHVCEDVSGAMQKTLPIWCWVGAIGLGRLRVQLVGFWGKGWSAGQLTGSGVRSERGCEEWRQACSQVGLKGEVLGLRTVVLRQ